MHPEVSQDHPGKCPKCCDMELVPESEAADPSHQHDQSSASYRPQLIIIALIALVTAVV